MEIMNRKDYNETDQLLLNLFYKPLKSDANHFDDNCKEMLITCLTGETENNFTDKNWNKLKKDILPIELLEKRLTLFDYTLHRSVILFLMFLTEGNPGTIVMYLSYLQIACKNMEFENINMSEFSRIFPLGYPHPNTIQTVWEQCKVDYASSIGTKQNGNLLDVVTPYKSLKRK